MYPWSSTPPPMGGWGTVPGVPHHPTHPAVPGTHHGYPAPRAALNGPLGSTGLAGRAVTGIPGNTREYPGIHRNTRDTREYPGIHRNTREYTEYTGIPGNTREYTEYTGIHGIPEYTGIHGIPEYTAIHGIHGIHGITQRSEAKRSEAKRSVSLLPLRFRFASLRFASLLEAAIAFRSHFWPKVTHFWPKVTVTFGQKWLSLLAKSSLVHHVLLAKSRLSFWPKAGSFWPEEAGFGQKKPALLAKYGPTGLIILYYPVFPVFPVFSGY